MCAEGESYIKKQLIDGLLTTGILPCLKFYNKKFSRTVPAEPSLVEETLAGRNIRLHVIKICFVYVYVKLQGGLNG